MAARSVVLIVALAVAASDAQRLEPAPRFLGWQSQRAIIEIDEPAATYWSLSAGRKMRRFRTTKHPDGLLPGHVLVSDYAPLEKDAVRFDFEADHADAEAMDRALEAASEDPAGRQLRFPDVHATLRITLHNRAIWTARKTYGVSMGEAGYEYRNPQLRLAVLSPRNDFLLIEITGSAGSEFFVLRVTGARG